MLFWPSLCVWGAKKEPIKQSVCLNAFSLQQRALGHNTLSPSVMWMKDTYCEVQRTATNKSKFNSTQTLLKTMLEHVQCWFMCKFGGKKCGCWYNQQINIVCILEPLLSFSSGPVVTIVCSIKCGENELWLKSWSLKSTNGHVLFKDCINKIWNAK